MAELPLTVLLLNVRMPSSFMRPPPKPAELPLRVLLVIVTVALPHQPIVRDAAAVIGRVAAQSAAAHYQRSLVVKDATADAFAPGAVNG